MRPTSFSILVAAVPLSIASSASAATYKVGPQEPYMDLASVAATLKPGDVVEVDGGHTYSGDLVLKTAGTKDAPIKIVGKRDANGKRPVFSGGATTIEVRADHWVIEGLEITGGQNRCFFHHADDVTLRDVVIHDCPKHGILGADDDSGSLTLEYVEVYKSGSGDSHHAIYMATDEKAHPKSVFRMEHCYLHDENGGNAVKSRAERNEIFYNWIEGALYHELELIGPDDDRIEGLAREDSDVVGNVLKKTQGSYMIRIGGDGSGQTLGRYRFVNNTFLMGKTSHAVFRYFDKLESVEMHDNVLYKDGGGPLQIVQDDDVKWSTGKALVAGSNNLVPSGSTKVPSEWVDTITANPGFVSYDDPEPSAKSKLVDAGTSSMKAVSGHDFPNPLAAPEFLPPMHRLEAVGAAKARPSDGKIDVGAFEFVKSTQPAALVRDTSDTDTGMTRKEKVKAELRSLKSSCACDFSREDQQRDGAVLIAALGLLGAAALRRKQRSAGVS